MDYRILLSVVRSSLLGFVISGAIGLMMEDGQAQVIPDGTLGSESSQVRNVLIQGSDGIDRDSDLIEGGARRENNLFHSFSQFDVLEGQGAYFANPNGVTNIFSRVTGTDRSEILGRLGVFGDANLFFMNPNGIVFGPDASLDLGGSFVATTANAIGFGDRGVFSTVGEVPEQLLTIDPSVFLFSQVPGDIANSSIAPDTIDGSFLGLRVPNGETLTLLGGNVVIDGGGGTQRAGLHAFGGRIAIGAVGGLGAIGINDDRSLSFPDSVARSDVAFTSRAIVDVSFDGGGD